ncbi:hypothetical protein PPL_08857 [Heterostelium album PN500]|uniref:Uncharacterized protein n=1 Tax=Heterostelium pallidum (strain ATCC 26659 / Pp 5 / PN500) TaxID=670386 RepID=D3BJX7_HETP5|nr:hypothetical protein PPL_08857 [Heterostelium album PN500]EFA78207.1 hypothetical protein PPL_08857 [Heterostelium album PN500]|eukprot:XP_020430333.1 hypothetical protein PPL_08857 [Heterostelium album PN500]
MAKKSKKKNSSGSSTNVSNNKNNSNSNNNNINGNVTLSNNASTTSTTPPLLSSFEKFINVDSSHFTGNNNSNNNNSNYSSNNSNIYDNNNNNSDMNSNDSNQPSHIQQHIQKQQNSHKINKILGMQLSDNDIAMLETTILKIKTSSQTKNYLKLQQELKPPHETVICSMRLANNEYYNERYTQAVEYYNTAIQLASQHPPFIVSILLNRAITKLRLQEYKKSILDCTLALSIQPNCIKAYICRAYGYFFTKEFKKAFSDHYMAVHIIPPCIPLRKAMRLSHRSRLLWQTVKLETLPPNLRYAQPYKGIQLDWLSDFNILAIEEEPCRMHLLTNFINSQIEKSQKTKEKPTQMPSLIPAGESFYGNLWSEFEEGISFLKLDRYLEAITDCSVSIEKQPSVKGMKAYLRRGAGYSAIGEYSAAEKDFRAALKYEPDSLEVLLGLEKTLKLREQEMRKTIIDNPSNVDLLQTLKLLQVEIEQLATKIAPSKNAEQKSSSSSSSSSSLSSSTSSSPLSTSSSQVVNSNNNNNNNNQNSNNNNSTNLNTSGNKINVNISVPSDKKPRVPFYKPFTSAHMAEKHEMLEYFTNLINKRIGHLPTSYLGRAEVHLQLDLLKNALDDYEKGLEIEPKNIDLLNRYKYVQGLSKSAL